ncbi:hypothetical protein GGR56DRAFT_638830 [Xylariaceae sp. FL0804]|nr:hypothetical protein GGR56DRAFT_638830 [Xylariaceae sp. FL0804]
MKESRSNYDKQHREFQNLTRNSFYQSQRHRFSESPLRTSKFQSSINQLEHPCKRLPGKYQYTQGHRVHPHSKRSYWFEKRKPAQHVSVAIKDLVNAIPERWGPSSNEKSRLTYGEGRAKDKKRHFLVSWLTCGLQVNLFSSLDWQVHRQSKGRICRLPVQGRILQQCTYRSAFRRGIVDPCILSGVSGIVRLGFGRVCSEAVQ